VLARNFWRFGRLTFDGQMSTNGVQPLWMWTQVALAGIFPHVDTATLLVRSTWSAYVVFSFLTVWFVARGPAIVAVLRTLLVSGLILFNIRVHVIVVQGLETSLFLIVLVTTLIMCDAWLGAESGGSRRELSTAPAAAMACLAALCFLARTDAFLIFLVVGLWMAMRVHRPAVALMTFGSVGGMLILPYLANNLWAHGALMPISGRGKLFYLSAFFPDRASYLAFDEWRALFQVLPAVIRLPASVTLSTRVAVTLMLITAGLLVVWRLHRPGRLPASLAILAWAALGRVLFMQFAYGELREYTSYYFAEMWWLAVCLTFWISQPARSTRQAVAAVAAAVVIGVVGFEWATRTLAPSTYWIGRINLAADISRLPSDAKVGAFWPGCFAAFSGRDIAPLDGIVGSNDYLQKYVKAGKEFGYIRERGIEYIAVYLPEAPAAILSRDAPPSLSYWSFINGCRPDDADLGRSKTDAGWRGCWVVPPAPRRVDRTSRLSVFSRPLTCSGARPVITRPRRRVPAAQRDRVALRRMPHHGDGSSDPSRVPRPKPWASTRDRSASY
jgi:hypothetical protein